MKHEDCIYLSKKNMILRLTLNVYLCDYFKLRVFNLALGYAVYTNLKTLWLTHILYGKKVKNKSLV